MLCFLDTGKQVLWQAVKTQIKCRMTWHFIKGLHCLLRLKQSSGTEIYPFIETLPENPLRYKMDYPILIVSICMG